MHVHPVVHACTCTIYSEHMHLVITACMCVYTVLTTVLSTVMSEACLWYVAEEKLPFVVHQNVMKEILDTGLRVDIGRLFVSSTETPQPLLLIL